MKFVVCSILFVLAATAPPSAQHPLLLQDSQGEQRIRLPRPGVNVQKIPSFIIKVDSQNGGARNLLMLSEQLKPGAVIPWHRHLHEDEIVYTENGTIHARVGDQEATLGSHATVYIPRNTWVTIRNLGAVPVRLIAIFDRSDFDTFLRCTSRAPGETLRTLSKRDATACQRAGDVEYR
jgi:quercetin dioxygenase-like cupin family protein